MSARGPIVAIDGPAGSGKTTLARGLAAELGLPYVNTGIMYRAVTNAALEKMVDPDDGPALARLAADLKFALSDGAPPALLVDGALPGPELTSEDVEAVVSRVSRHPEVRKLMAAEQRRLGRDGAVMEGRDIGTVIFPDADLKVFLVATPSERAARRAEERGGEEELTAGMASRDAQDARVNPFVPAPDALELNTTGKTPEEVLAGVLAALRERLGSR